jgi:hypothetical protein
MIPLLGYIELNPNKPNGTVHIRHLCSKTAVSSCHRCLINNDLVQIANCKVENSSRLAIMLIGGCVAPYSLSVGSLLRPPDKKKNSWKNDLSISPNTVDKLII